MKGAQILVDILDVLIAASGILDGVTIHLTKDTFIPSPYTTIAELVTHEADYEGYAASSAVVWLAPWVDGSGTGHVPGTSVQFQPTGDATPNDIYGYWIQKGTGGSAKLVSFVELPEAVSLINEFSSLIVDPVFSIEQ